MSQRAAIQPLSDNVINQIAAGEVIERPASIVKELLENSLDAGATKISVTLSDGGIESIRIDDDGHGIPPEQLQLALSRHCTSKLIDAVDLEAISSLGFRGEALASISSVAEISIVSRTPDQAHAWRIDMQPGRSASDPRPQAHAYGTTIEVRSLFATTPVRRRFVKQARTEFLHIQQFMKRAGFCYPEVALVLVHGLKQNMSLPRPAHPSSTERRWRSLFGSDFVEHALAVEFPSPEVRVHGWVGEQAYSRQNADLQYIAINRRIVRDRHIAHAVRMAYAASVEQGRHPCYALHLELPPHTVDVNVHPGKAEVRFHNPRTVHDIVYAAVKQTLDGKQPIAPGGSYTQMVSGQNAVHVAEPVYRERSFSRPLSANAPAKSDLGVDSDNLLAISDAQFAFINNKGSIRVIDLHPAISALVGARLQRGDRDPRPLLIPETMPVELSDERMAALEPFGVVVGRLSEATVALRAVPIVVREIDQGIFGLSLVASVTSGASEISAIATAAAAAFQPPTGVAERRQWFAQLAIQLRDLGLGLDGFSIALKREFLLDLFGSQQR